MTSTLRIFLALFVGFTASARADLIDDYVLSQMSLKQVPGLSLAVLHDGKVLKTRGYGLANVELTASATEETVFEIGSITKQFTAALVLMLIEENKLGLEDSVTKYFTNAPESWKPITLRHLLTHTSGIKNYTGLPGFECSKHLNADQFTKAISAYPLASEPGQKFAYCNSGYNLLGFIIEKVTGKSYWEMLNARILTPLGMKATQSRDTRKVIMHRASGYEKEKNVLLNRERELTDIFSAGAISSTVLDLIKWNSALESGRLLKPASIDLMWTPTKLTTGEMYPYGFGWRMDDYHGSKCIGHGGSTSGFSSTIKRFPQARLAVIVLSNSGEEGIASEIAKGVADFLLPSHQPVARK
ncbi:MAG TPA: serine hydrolase domain-containing protein [Verrucomicrobiae bacterium]